MMTILLRGASRGRDTVQVPGPGHVSRLAQAARARSAVPLQLPRLAVTSVARLFSQVPAGELHHLFQVNYCSFRRWSVFFVEEISNTM